LLFFCVCIEVLVFDLKHQRVSVLARGILTIEPLPLELTVES
jgi:hypothetical protein